MHRLRPFSRHNEPVAHPGERVLRMRPAADDGIDVVFFARLDAERSQQLDDPIPIEVRVRDADFGSVPGGEGGIIIGRAKAEARIVDRAECEGDRSAGDEHPRKFCEARSEFGQRSVEIGVRRKRAREIPSRELCVRGFLIDFSDLEAGRSERARVATAAGPDLDDLAARLVKNFDQSVRKRMSVLR